MLDTFDSFAESFSNLQEVFVSWLPSDYSLLLVGAFAILVILAIKRIFIN